MTAVTVLDRPPGPGAFTRVREGKVFPILTIVAAIFAVWYVFAVVLNTPWQRDLYARGNVEWTTSDLVRDTLAQDRPVLPSPHQVVAEMWRTTVGVSPTSRRSLLYHAWITLSSTLLGFAIGTLLGILLAVFIVHNRAMDKSVMPWVIASQTIPILAIAPMIIVVLNAIGLTGLLPKALISTYLSFFPVVVGMVKGLRSPEIIQLDLMRTYNASGPHSIWKQRWPRALP
jgi:NitT/TauT family transport system permease protein